MLNNNLEIYGFCNLEKPPIPPRSRLYHLEPIGIGTPYVESLTSYITRLAEAHCILPVSLISTIIAPQLKQTFIKDCSSRNLSILFKKSQVINSYGNIAQEISQSLEELTFRTNLSCLTLSSFKELFSIRNLHRQSKAWCSACYEQWYQEGKTVYEPLLWTIADVKVCHHHHQVLKTVCSHCNRSIPWLTGRAKIGYCSYCDRWLGNFDRIITYNNVGYSEAEFAKNIWIANTVGELISSTPQVSSSLRKAHISKALNQIIALTHEGNITSFARTFGLPKNTVWLWCKGKSTPELRPLLAICYCLNISLRDFITLKDKAFKSMRIDVKKLPTAPRNKRASPRRFDYETIENYLQTILNDSEIPPPTIKEIAQKLGLDRRTILGYFPALCKAISAKSRCYQKLSKVQRIENCCREIEEAVINIYKSGEYPTEARVSQLVSQPGYFRYKEVRNTLKKAILNLKL